MNATRSHCRTIINSSNQAQSRYKGNQEDKNSFNSTDWGSPAFSQWRVTILILWGLSPAFDAVIYVLLMFFMCKEQGFRMIYSNCQWKGKHQNEWNCFSVDVALFFKVQHDQLWSDFKPVCRHHVNWQGGTDFIKLSPSAWCLSNIETSCTSMKATQWQCYRWRKDLKDPKLRHGLLWSHVKSIIYFGVWECF